MKYSKLDAIGGALAESVIGFFIVLACAVTIFAHGIPVNNVVDISKALVPLAGELCEHIICIWILKRINIISKYRTIGNSIFSL